MRTVRFPARGTGPRPEGEVKRRFEHHFKEHIWLRPGQYPGAKGGPAAACPSGAVHSRGKYFSGQAVRQGFPAAAVSAAGPKTKTGRFALHQEHRPAGTQLW